MKIMYLIRFFLPVGASLLLAAFSTSYANTVVMPKLDVNGEGTTSVGSRIYPGFGNDPDVTVSILDYLEDGFLFEHQVQGVGVSPSSKIPSRSILGGVNLSFFTPKSDATIRSELWFEGSRSKNFSKGDNPWKDSTHSNWIPWNEERATGFNVFIPSLSGSTDSAKAANAGNGIIMQWWQFAEAVPPMALSFTIENGKPSFVLQVSGNVSGSSKTMDVIFPFEYSDLGNWFDIILEYKLSTTTTGSVQIWIRKHSDTIWRDGFDRINKTPTGGFTRLDRRSVKMSNIKIGFTQSTNGISHKFGIYRPGKQLNDWTIYFDNIFNDKRYGDVSAVIGW